MRRAARMLPTLLLLCLLLPAPAEAESARVLTPSLRPGQYVPLKLTLDPSTPHRIEADGVLPIDLPAGVTRVIVPLLTFDSPGDSLLVRVNGTPVTIPLEPAGSEETWIAVLATLEDGLVRSLAPADRPARVVAIDPSAPALSLDAFDVVVIDPRTRARLADADLGTLLAAGVTIALRADAPPDDRWTWSPRGSFQLLRSPAAGLGTLGPSEGVYDAILGFSPSRPRGFRVLLLAAGAGVAIAIFAAATLPRRAGMVACVLIAVFATAGVVAWRAVASPVARAEGLVAVAPEDAPGRIDAWTILLSPDAASVTLDLHGVGGVVPFSAAHLRSIAPRLACDELGRPRSLTLSLPPRRAVAVLDRVSLPTIPRAMGDGPPPPPWLMALARRLYASPDWRIDAASGTVRVTRTE